MGRGQQESSPATDTEASQFLGPKGQKARSYLFTYAEPQLEEFSPGNSKQGNKRVAHRTQGNLSPLKGNIQKAETRSRESTSYAGAAWAGLGISLRECKEFYLFFHLVYFYVLTSLAGKQS